MVVILAYGTGTESCVIKMSQKVGIYGVLLIRGEVFVFICGFAEGTVDSSSNAGVTGIWEGEHVQFLNESGSEEIVMGYSDKTI